MSRVCRSRPGATSTHLRRGLVGLLANALLVAGAGCSDETTFEPGARLDPETALAFGATNVAEEKTLTIEVFNNGSAGLTVLDTIVTPPEKFAVVVEDDLLAAIPPGATSTITVTYRPCPAAWNGDERIRDFDITTCPGGLDSAELQITDNTANPAKTLTLSGQPVQPPNASCRCVQAEGVCNMPDAQRSQCVSLRFGDVVAGSGTDCDLFVELVNSNRSDGSGNDVPVAPLTIERAEILVNDIFDQDSPNVRGAEAGFSFLTEDGQPLEFPIDIPVPDGQSSGSRLIRVRFNGQAGIWLGSQTDELGLRIFTNDPQNPLKTILVSASGTAPDIEVIPRLVDFGSVDQGRTVTGTISVRNQGNADLVITSTMLRPENTEFSFRAADGMPIERTLTPNRPGDRFDVLVSYTPSDPSSDRVFWDIYSNDPDTAEAVAGTGRPVENPFPVESRGGPTPAFCFEPRSSVLEFPIPDPPDGMPRTREVSLQSCGSGNLSITGLDIQNEGTPESVDDFSIDLPGCSTLPCNPMIELCPETDADCMIGGVMPGIEAAVPVVYDNNDTSTQDLAALVVTTDDPSLPEVRITLQASDNPCLPPRVNVEQVPVMGSLDACVPQAIQLQVAGDPGGPIGGNASVATCDWNLDFAPTTPNVFSPDMVPEACTMTQLLPTSPGGLHLISVTVRNSCGAQATSPRERIDVAPDCD